MNQPQYKTLVAGDVRQEGDETRHKGYSKMNTSDAPLHPGPWTPVSKGMVGHTILPSDLIVGEFRRPI